MKRAGILLKLIRWPNLFFIAITQILFYYIVFPYAYFINGLDASNIKLQPGVFFIILLASVLIAAAGYIINDYFDVNIDQVNKSSKVIIGKSVHRRAAILMHALFSLTGLLLTAYAAYRLRNFYILIFNAGAVILLLFYSTTFKRKLLIGNIIISLLTSWVILVLTAAEYRFTFQFDVTWQLLLKLSILYGGFAFIISLIREVIKDMEDVQGDMKYNCRTMPVVWGMSVSKVFSAVWIVVLGGMVCVLMIYILTYGRWLAALYGIILVVIPLAYVLKYLYKAIIPEDFHKLSAMVKWIMFTGILSMLFFLSYKL